MGQLRDAIAQSRGGQGHNEHCVLCRFWFRVGKDVVGFCTSFPPTGREWSYSKEDDWCGEFKPTPGKPHPWKSDVR